MVGVVLVASAYSRAALSRWFGPEGINARFIRMHIDSCDYSLSEYQSVADPIADPELETFTIDRDRKWTLPVVKEALAMAGGELCVLLSPWSPPYQWKTPPEFSQNDAAVYGGVEHPLLLSYFAASPDGTGGPAKGPFPLAAGAGICSS